MVIELAAHLGDHPAQDGQVHHHARVWLARAAHDHLGGVRVAMDAAAACSLFGRHLAFERVRRIKGKGLTQLEHQQSFKGAALQRMPTDL